MSHRCGSSLHWSTHWSATGRRSWVPRIFNRSLYWFYFHFFHCFLYADELRTLLNINMTAIERFWIVLVEFWTKSLCFHLDFEQPNSSLSLRPASTGQHPSKRGLTSFAIPGHDPPLHLTIFVDISINPGPVPYQRLVFNFSASHVVLSNLHTGPTFFSTSRTSYSRSFLLGLRMSCHTKLPMLTLRALQNSGILKFRGRRAGRRKIRTIISARSTSACSAPLHSCVNRSNLISISLQSGPEFVPPRQVAVSKFALINSRSIRNKTLMLNDYATEHNIDILAITETWLHDDEFDVYVTGDLSLD